MSLDRYKRDFISMNANLFPNIRVGLQNHITKHNRVDPVFCILVDLTIIQSITDFIMVWLGPILMVIMPTPKTTPTYAYTLTIGQCACKHFQYVAQELWALFLQR